MKAKDKLQLTILKKRREELRRKLKHHFSLPVNDRNYSEFEGIVDELDSVRQKIKALLTPARRING